VQKVGTGGLGIKKVECVSRGEVRDYPTCGRGSLKEEKAQWIREREKGSAERVHGVLGDIGRRRLCFSQGSVGCSPPSPPRVWTTEQILGSGSSHKSQEWGGPVNVRGKAVGRIKCTRKRAGGEKLVKLS